MRTKGQVEDALGKLDYPMLCVHRPGLLLNRDNDKRMGEKIGSYLPFFPKMEARDVGKVILEHALRSVKEYETSQEKKKSLLENKDMIAYMASL